MTIISTPPPVVNLSTRLPAAAPALDPVIDALVGEKVVAHRPMFARAFGGATVGLLLSQFWFYSCMETAKGRDGWFYAPQEQIEEDTGMTRPEQETARRKLRELKVLHEDKAGVPSKLWFQIDKVRAMELLRLFLVQDALDKQVREDKKEEKRLARKQVRGKAPDKDAENPHTGMLESAEQGGGEAADKSAQKPRAITKSPPQKHLRNSETPLRAAPAAPDSASLFAGEEPEQKEPKKSGPATQRWTNLPEPDRVPWLDRARGELAAIHAGSGITPKPKLVEVRARNLYETSL